MNDDNSIYNYDTDTLPYERHCEHTDYVVMYDLLFRRLIFKKEL